MKKDPFEYFKQHQKMMENIFKHHELINSLDSSVLNSFNNGPNWSQINDLFQSSAVIFSNQNQSLFEQFETTRQLFEQTHVNQELYNRLAPINNVVEDLVQIHSNAMSNLVPSDVFSRLNNLEASLDNVLPTEYEEKHQEVLEDNQDQEVIIEKINWFQLIQLILSIWLAYTSHLAQEEQMVEMRKQTELQQRNLEIQERQLEIDTQRLQHEKEQLKKHNDFEVDFKNFIEVILPLIPENQDVPESDPSNE